MPPAMQIIRDAALREARVDQRQHGTCSRESQDVAVVHPRVKRRTNPMLDTPIERAVKKRSTAMTPPENRVNRHLRQRLLDFANRDAQKISAKIASVPRYGIGLAPSGVARAAGISSRTAVPASGIGPALIRRSTSRRRCHVSTCSPR